MFLNQYCIKFELPESEAHFFKCDGISHLNDTPTLDMGEYGTLFGLDLVMTAYLNERLDDMVKAIDVIIDEH